MIAKVEVLPKYCISETIQGIKGKKNVVTTSHSPIGKKMDE